MAEQGKELFELQVRLELLNLAPTADDANTATELRETHETKMTDWISALEAYDSTVETIAAPEAYMFAVWSAAAREIIPSGIIGANYKDYKENVALQAEDAASGEIGHIAVLGNFIRNDVRALMNYGAVHMYANPNGFVRYDITDPAYQVELVPFQLPSNKLVRFGSEGPWQQYFN